MCGVEDLEEILGMPRDQIREMLDAGACISLPRRPERPWPVVEKVLLVMLVSGWTGFLPSSGCRLPPVGRL